MINTNEIRAKIDGLCAADGADTYWRDRMLEALDEIDELRLRKPLAEEYEEVLAELASKDTELNEVWDTLGLAEYDGEDSPSHFIEKLQQIVEKHKGCSANLLAAFTEFQSTLPPVSTQTEYSAGARYAMITILENLRRKLPPWKS